MAPQFTCTALHFTALYCTALHCTTLHCAALHSGVYVEMFSEDKIILAQAEYTMNMINGLESEQYSCKESSDTVFWKPNSFKNASYISYIYFISLDCRSYKFTTFAKQIIPVFVIAI